jgi:hypothetical protein
LRLTRRQEQERQTKTHCQWFSRRCVNFFVRTEGSLFN